MTNADQVADSKFRDWLKKHKRSLIGGSIGFLFSGWILHGIKTDNPSRVLEFVLDLVPFLSIIVGAPLMFLPSSWGTAFFVAILWGVIGALLASSTPKQRRIGLLVLLVLAAIGIYALILIIIYLPT
jgi:hypothetical protein